VLVAAKIAVVPCDTAFEVTETIDRAEAKIRDSEPMVTALYLEPDIYDPNHVPAPRPERPAAPSH
jgi:molybdopterin-guanine dinucleotide biosynthesis protein A